MNRNTWIGIVVVVILVVGGSWYLNQSNIPVVSGAIQMPTGQTTQQNTTTKTQPVSTQSLQPAKTSSVPSATLNTSSLTSTTDTPTLTGTLSSTASICVEIGKDPMPKNIGDAQGIQIVPNSVFQSCAPHDSNFSIANGRWSMSTAVNADNVFTNGTYTVGVYDDTPGSDFGNLLTSGTLTIATSQANTAPSCTLTASPARISVGQTYTLTWTSQHATAATMMEEGTPGPAKVSLNGSTNPTTADASGMLNFKLTVTSNAGTNSCSTLVTVS